MDEFFARNRLSAYIDGELTAAETAEVADAIEKNEALRKEYKEMLRAVEFMRSHGPVAAPPHFHLKVMQAVEGLPAPSRRFAWLRLPFLHASWEGLAVAAVAATVVVLVWVAPTRQETSTTQGEDQGQDVPPSLPGEVATSDPATSSTAAPPSPGNDGLADAANAGAPGERTGSSTPPADEGDPTATPTPAPPHDAVEQTVVESQVSRKVRLSPTPVRLPGEEPYVPEWDRDPGQTSGAATASGGTPRATAHPPAAFILYPNHPNALKGISDVAYKVGGTALMANGQALVPFDLTTEKNHARVILQVPVDQVRNVEGQLKSLGGVVTLDEPAEAAPGAGAVPVYIEVLYEP